MVARKADLLSGAAAPYVAMDLPVTLQPGTNSRPSPSTPTTISKMFHTVFGKRKSIMPL